MRDALKAGIYRRRLILLLVISSLVRLLIGSVIELGNDEVYYVTYALFPDLSHFDHPPMVGWIIQLFTLNLTFESEGWIRLAAVTAGTLGTLLAFLLGKKIGDAQTGWYTALLYTASIYSFIIAGTFIMPDSPQVLFWMLSLLLLMHTADALNDLRNNDTANQSRIKFTYRMLLTGLAAGLALLSKYTSGIVLFGAFLYFIKNPAWFKRWQVYAALVLALICFLPVVIWNVDNNFISFTFHGDRVEVAQNPIRMDYFGRELGGQFAYNNPVVFVLVVIGLIAIFRKKLRLKNDYAWLLIFTALPPIVLFLGISLFRATLPHWTGPAYITLLPVAALWISQHTSGGKTEKALPVPVTAALGLLVTLLAVALLQIFTGVFVNKPVEKMTGKSKGAYDVTLDLYGWEQLGNKFSALYQNDIRSGIMDTSAVILSHRWFPAANLDYYVARPNNIKLITEGPLIKTHKYDWITRARGGAVQGTKAYFIASGADYASPQDVYGDKLTGLKAPDTIPIFRREVPVKLFYVWRFEIP